MAEGFVRRCRLLFALPLLTTAGLAGCAVPPPCPQLPVDAALSPDLRVDSGPARWLYTEGGVLLRYESDDPYGNFINRLWRVDPATLAETPLLDRPGITAEVRGSVSADARYVAVRSTESLDGSADPFPQFADAWLIDTDTGDATRLTSGNGSVDHVTVSDDGQRVAFDSWATDLTPEADLNPENLGGGEPSWQDVFVWDRDADEVTRLTNEQGVASFSSRISAGGDRVGFSRIGERLLVDLASATIAAVPSISGVDQFGHDVDMQAALRPDRAVGIDTARAVLPDDLDGATDLYVFDPATSQWRNATDPGNLSTYPLRYWEPFGPQRFPSFIVAPLFATSSDGATTVALEGVPTHGQLVRRSGSGTQVLTDGFEWHHLSRVAISPDGRTVVATLARFQDDRYCGVRPWRTFVWTFDIVRAA